MVWYRSEVFQTDLYHSYRAVCTSPPSYRYADRSLPGGTAKIDRWRSISAVDGRLREKSTVGGRLREKKGRRRRGKEERRRIPRAVLACTPLPPVGCPRAVLALTPAVCIGDCLLSGKALYRAVCTGSPTDWYADCPLPGGTAQIGRRRLISVIAGRLREKEGEEEEGEKEEGEEEGEIYLARVALPKFPGAVRHPRAKNRLRDPLSSGDSFLCGFISPRMEKE
ncbi:hypothetical protein GW17_00057093 [Ensete ventricosum]|nr:hypothetical protein GW17_00057093 [Ensete ventricosum]